MSGADLIALYAAVVATAVAVIQHNYWKATQRQFSVACLPARFNRGEVEVFVTALGNLPVTISYIGIGMSFRPWICPWKRVEADNFPLRKIDEGIRLDKFFGSTRLRPGDSIEGHCRVDDWQEVSLKGTRWRGFGFLPCILICHSLNENTYIKVLT